MPGYSPSLSFLPLDGPGIFSSYSGVGGREIFSPSMVAECNCGTLRSTWEVQADGDGISGEKEERGGVRKGSPPRDG